MFSQRISSLTLSALIILPPLLISTYIAWPYYQAQQQSPLIPVLTYTELSFPDKETQKLPIQAVQLALQSSINSDVKIVNTSDIQGTIQQEKRKENTVLFNVDELDLSGLSPELAARFESVLSEPSDIEDRDDDSTSYDDAAYIELDKRGAQFSGRLPPLNFQTHNYTSKPSYRWVKVNDKEVNIGASISNGITLLEINPRDVVIEFQGQKIEVPALYEWKG